MVEGEPQHIAQIEQGKARLQARILAGVTHNETGLDIARINGFLAEYGLVPETFIAVPDDKNREIEKFTELKSHGDHKIGGAYFGSANLVYALRNRKIEEKIGTAGTESTAVHEQSHANRIIVTGYAALGETVTRHAVLRGGFQLADALFPSAGSYFEEGFAALMQNRYLTEKVGMRNGLLGLDGTYDTSFIDKIYKIPRSYSDFQEIGGILQPRLPIPAHAAYGMDLLIAQDPSIFDAMLRSRSDIAGLKEFAQRINALSPGLYTILRQQPYKQGGREFMAATSHIVDLLYDADPDQAATAVTDR